MEDKAFAPAGVDIGRFEDIDVGIRQLIRKKPLEIEIINGIKIPTDNELLRIKALLIVTRNAVRDYVDFVALCDGMSKKTCSMQWIALMNAIRSLKIAKKRLFS